jgi:hypothetical protein
MDRFLEGDTVRFKEDFALYEIIVISINKMEYEGILFGVTAMRAE